MGFDPVTKAGTKLIGSATPALNGVVPAVVGTLTSGWRVAGTGDANKDGIPDIYWHNRTSGSIVVWYMAAGGNVITSSATVAGVAAPEPWRVAKSSSYPRLTAENKLTFDASDRISSAGYSYDTNGNVTATPAIIGQTATTYAYTAANKLLRTVNNGVTTEYQYDGSGNLIRQIRAGVTTDYVLDENRGLANVIGEISGNTETAYVFGAEGLHAQQRWVSNVAQGVEYPLTDGLGSIKAITNASGALTKAMSYDAWGQLRYNNGSTPSAFGFTGEQSMADGTTYLRARSYLPAMGRFLQRDSFAGFAGRTQSLNRYAYVEGNPTGFVDPSGFARAESNGNIIDIPGIGRPDQWLCRMNPFCVEPACGTVKPGPKPTGKPAPAPTDKPIPKTDPKPEPKDECAWNDLGCHMRKIWEMTPWGNPKKESPPASPERTVPDWANCPDGKRCTDSTEKSGEKLGGGIPGFNVEGSGNRDKTQRTVEPATPCKSTWPWGACREYFPPAQVSTPAPTPSPANSAPTQSSNPNKHTHLDFRKPGPPVKTETSTNGRGGDSSTLPNGDLGINQKIYKR
jgi:RHS repeat-associated protein